ncbi:low temperature requirement protein A [Oenococcus sp.]|uniref:low temperature requirement protein A n=1 Tax=Oenococcus sp. TaxID=1979414 RepID=UPI0039EA9B23
MLNFFGRPRNITEQIRHRKISWLELFYDLIFSVVLERLTSGLVADFSWPRFFNASVLFFWFFWSWHETSGYFDNHGNDSILNVLIINVQLILAGIAALFIPDAIAGNYTNILIAFVPMELLLIAVWYIIGHFDPTHGPASRAWATVYSFALLLLLIGLFAPTAGKFVIILATLLINYLVVFFANPRLRREYENTHMPFVLKDSLIERYGLMTMIALGEVIVGLYEAIGHPVTMLGLTEFIMSIVLVALVTAVYYQVIGELHVQMASSIQVMAVRWLFLLDIYAVMLFGVFLIFVLEKDQLAQRLWLSFLLFASLFVMWLIQRITSHDKQARGTNKPLFFMFEFAAMLTVAFLHKSWMILCLDLIMLLVILHYRYIQPVKAEN